MYGKRRVITGFMAGVITTVFLLVTVTGAFFVANEQNLARAIRVISIIKTDALETVSTDQMIEGAIKGIVGSLDDPYSVYMEPRDYEQLESHMEGSYGGVGIWVGMREENELTVISPIKGSPASKEGLLPGDVIVKIDEHDTHNMDMDRAVELMKGEPGTEVVLSIYRKGVRELKEFTIVREIINIPSVDGKILEEERDIAYIDITMFSNTTSKDLAHKLAEFNKEGFKGLILDLRDNPGGGLLAAYEVAEFFVPEGPIVHIVDSRRTQTLEASGKALNIPLVVLVNQGSASASEIVAGAIRDSNAGTLVGTQTFGKGLVQTVFPLDGGTAVKLTTAKYLTPDKHDIDKKGIEPDYIVELSAEDPEDLQLQKAIELLKEKI